MRRPRRALRAWAAPAGVVPELYGASPGDVLACARAVADGVETLLVADGVETLLVVGRRLIIAPSSVSFTYIVKM